MRLALQSVRVGTGAEEDGLLVFAENRLVAVLVHLSDENEIAPGAWFLETGYGRLDGPDHPTFSDLDAAQNWIGRRLVEGKLRSSVASKGEPQ